MPLRWDDADRTLALSVRDLVERAPPTGHLVIDLAQSALARFTAGRLAHQGWQAARAEDDPSFRAEVTVRHTFDVGGWTVTLHGRVDGLTELHGHTIVEEIKSTALDAGRLYGTTLADWPGHVEQLAIYLWMLHRSGHLLPEGRLILLGLADGARHVLGVPLAADEVGGRVLQRLTRLVAARDRRNAWLAARRTWVVPDAFSPWRPGQTPIRHAVHDALDRGVRLMVEAPTGLGKTAAVLDGALRHALRHDRTVFWATSRNTQADGVVAAVDRLRAAGLPLRRVVLRGREHNCLNDAVTCRPDLCRFARHHHDKVAAADLHDPLTTGPLDPPRARALGLEHEVCPHELLLDATLTADVVIGDVNHALAPGVRLQRLFGEEVATERVLVVDEAHQLVERARDHHSPRLTAAELQAAIDHLTALGPAFTGLRQLAADALHEVMRTEPDGQQHGDVAEAGLLLVPWQQLATAIDEVAWDYARLKAEHDLAGTDDPWIRAARAVLRFHDALADADEHTRALVHTAPSTPALRLFCLDPGPRLAMMWAQLGGVVLCSATLSPHTVYRDLLGLPDTTEVVTAPSPFPPERRRVLLLPQVTTTFRRRVGEAAPTAALLSDALRAVPGHAALFFPSFALLDDLCDRLSIDGRDLLRQTPAMDDGARAAWIERLRLPSPPAVLAAVLGGIFAEGIDLPPGALDAVFVVGPALPPVGLERNLVRDAYEARFGAGFRYAYLVPGLTRVVQAAGRLLRRPEDRGAIVLVDRRFGWKDYAAHLPADWAPERSDDPAADLTAFFGAVPA